MDKIAEIKRITKSEIDRQQLIINQLGILAALLELTKPVSGISEVFEPVFEEGEEEMIKYKVFELIKKMQ